MKVTPIDDAELSTDGRRFGEYARTEAGKLVFVWYHDGLYSYDEPAWAMGGREEAKIDERVEEILVPYRGRVYAIEREAFGRSVGTIDGNHQLIAAASDGFVTYMGTAEANLSGHLDMTHVEDGYHQRANH